MHPLSTHMEELKQIITEALEYVTKDMLHGIWQKLDYKLKVCRITGVAHIEHL